MCAVFDLVFMRPCTSFFICIQGIASVINVCLLWLIFMAVDLCVWNLNDMYTDVIMTFVINITLSYLICSCCSFHIICAWTTACVYYVRYKNANVVFGAPNKLFNFIVLNSLCYTATSVKNWGRSLANAGTIKVNKLQKHSDYNCSHTIRAFGKVAALVLLPGKETSLIELYQQKEPENKHSGRWFYTQQSFKSDVFYVMTQNKRPIHFK